jgi:CRP-like cAMP-binding protein
VELETMTFFQGLDPEVVSKIRSAMTVQNYLGNDLIYSEGDPAKDFFILRDGKVLLTCSLPQDAASEIRITQVKPGETFGWAALTHEESVSTRARALDDSSAYAIPAEALHAILREYPQAGYELMRRLFDCIVRRLRDTRDELRWLKQGAR